MKNQLTKASSDISRTNQLKISDNPQQDIAEKLFQYLFKNNRGIEFFELKYSPHKNDNYEYEASEDDNSSYYKGRHKYIKQQIKERLSENGIDVEYSKIGYFLSSSDGKTYVFFLSSNKKDSRWKKKFKDNRERIFNLVFKFYLLNMNLRKEKIETINGFEELLLIHEKPNKLKDGTLSVWGLNLLIKYNQHNVLTLNLTRKHQRFSKTGYSITDGDDMGELLVYENKNYYFDRNLDARRQNDISFMDFPDKKNEKDYQNFKKTQLYHYQNLMTKLEDFLTECDIAFESLHFQADHYLENPFITNIESVESLEIINNTGVDFTESDQQFIKNFLRHQGFVDITFYHNGKTISHYESIESEGEDKPCWQITEVIPWSSIELNKDKNYLVFNKLLEEEAGSMAYQRKDGFWCPSTKIDNQSKIDFYSQLKKKFNYLTTGTFYSTQGINISEFKSIAKQQSQQKKDETENQQSILTYKNIDLDAIRLDIQAVENSQFLEKYELLSYYLRTQENSEKWKNFIKEYKIKISSEYQKILIEIGIKNWIRKSITDNNIGLPITPQSFSKKRFYVIYVRSYKHKNKEEKAVAVEFLYQEGCIYIKNIMCDLKQIEQEFRFIRKRNNSEKLINGQQYFVDESKQVYISCYISDWFTPTLIGRNGILEELENKTLKINRAIKAENSSRLLPLVSYYNSNMKRIKDIQNRICFDLHNNEFIQYYVPPAQSIEKKIKRGFRVYHLIGKTASGESIPTSELLELPITALHFSTLTQDILKISDNSQSSLLQKVAKVLIEN